MERAEDVFRGSRFTIAVVRPSLTLHAECPHLLLMRLVHSSGQEWIEDITKGTLQPKQPLQCTVEVAERPTNWVGGQSRELWLGAPRWGTTKRRWHVSQRTANAQITGIGDLVPPPGRVVQHVSGLKRCRVAGKTEQRMLG